MCPPRDELLSIVRKHSNSLGRSVPDGSKGGDGAEDEVDMRFWQELLDMFFIRGVVDVKASSDDLLFFVRLMSLQYGDGGLSEEEKSPPEPYFVRRWDPELKKVIGDRAWEVDWRRSFYLNLIAHTAYTLTVATCSRDALQSYRKSPSIPLNPIYKITKRVYASPSRSNFQKKSSKASETVLSYPDIYFSVDDYDDTFENLILTEEDHCYCVLLHASGGAAFGGNTSENDKTRSALSTQLSGGSNSTVTLFSGFVNYEMVRSAFETGRVSFGFLQLGGKSERLVMRGPGGRGEVDVIVSRVTAPSEELAEAPSPISSEKAGAKLGIGTIMRKAAVAAKHAYLAASSAQNDDVVPLRCCLMSLSLPWETLACDLLFKALEITSENI